MSCAIVHGPIGIGKTKACLDLAKRARAEGSTPRGVISPAAFSHGEQIGYDCLDIFSGEAFPLVRLKGLVKSPEWFHHGNLKYAFSVPGFKRANLILSRSAEATGPTPLVFVDEFGRLERAGRGFYSGAVRVAESLTPGCAAVFACRTDTVDAVKKLVLGRAREVREFKPGDADSIWRYIQRVLGRELPT
jgi:nucleoside-triphosphatase THEP1